MTRVSETHVPDLVTWIHPSLVVGPSHLHGKGVIAQAHVAAGERLVGFGGFLLALTDDADPRILRSTAIGIAPSIILCQLSGTAKDTSDYLNHSCDPNSRFDDALSLVATHCVSPGEEITVDYAYWGSDDTWLLRSICNCRADTCRAIVSGRDWMDEQMRTRLLRDAMPHIRRKVFSLGVTHG